MWYSGLNFRIEIEDISEESFEIRVVFSSINSVVSILVS